jgi:hypothetical protein
MARPRPRHDLPTPLFVVLRPLFRYSYSRDAYVLRAVGNRLGPVVRPRGGMTERMS